MTIAMYDSVTTSALPEGAQAYAGYVNGLYANYNAIKARFPGAQVLSIAVDPAYDADCLDIETGDATPGEAASWVLRQFTRGIVPCLYANVSTMIAVVADMQAAGVSRDSLRLWSAHYAEEHICGPASCREISIQMDGTQWTDTAVGNTCDQSLLLDSFFGPVIPSPPALTAAQTEAILNNLPILQQGAADHSGQVQFVHRMQALVAVISTINTIPAGRITADGAFGLSTKAGLEAVQHFFGITEDGICGPETWAKLVTG
jgi:peptidoglycan hydrolase-like protein with peptidoglycan-binding domain